MSRSIALLALLAAFACPPSAAKTPLPDPSGLTDLAGILPGKDADWVAWRLTQLRQFSCVDIKVLITRDTQDPAPGLATEPFASALHEAWSDGRDDVILLFVRTEPAAAMIVLGADFNPSSRLDAQRVASENIQPWIESGKVSVGIRGGVASIANTIVRNHLYSRYLADPSARVPFPLTACATDRTGAAISAPSR